MALSTYKLFARKAKSGTTGYASISHDLYTAQSDITDGKFATFEDENNSLVYLPITTNLSSYYASALRFRNKTTGQVYAAKTTFTPFTNTETITNNAYLYNLGGQVSGAYYNLGSVPFIVLDADKPLLVTLKLTGQTNTSGGWADMVYTKIGIHIDKEPYMILEYASYGKSGVIPYSNTVIANKVPYTLDAGPHTVGLCVWATCTSKDHNDFYVNSVEITLESAGV